MKTRTSLAEALARGTGMAFPVRVEDLAGLELHRLLRWLPGRRAVYAATRNGEAVLVKVFAANRRGRRDALREREALRKLQEAGIPAPALVEYLETDGGVRCLIIEWLEGATALSLYEDAGGSDARTALIADLFGFVSDLQHNGCEQTDIHPGNFMRTPRGWFVLDAGACLVGSRPLAPARARRNGALLLAQFHPGDLPPFPALARDPDTGGVALERAWRAAWARRARHVMAKPFRACSEFFVIRTDTVRGMGARRHEHLVERLLASGVDAVLENGTQLKDGNSSTVARATLDGHSLVIKRYNNKGLVHGLLRRLKETRARRSWRNAHYLRLLGIGTPAPVTFLEDRVGVLRRAWYLTEYVDAPPVSALPEARLREEGVVPELVRLFRLMDRFGFAHGDMKATNLLWHNGRLVLIDLDAMTFGQGRGVSRRALREDRERLLRNWPAGEFRTGLAQALDFF